MSKLQNNFVQLVYYFNESINENCQIDDNDFLFESDDLFIYEVFSVSALNDESALNELNVVELFDDALKFKDKKNFIDF